MLFCYYDLPMVKPISDDKKSEHSNGFEHSVNSSATKVERSYNYPDDTVTDNLTSSGEVIDGEKQKLVNLNAAGHHRRPRKASVMEKWHLARGKLEAYHRTLNCCLLFVE